MRGRGEQRGRHEVAARRHAVSNAAFGRHGQAVGQALGDVAVHALKLRLVDDGAAGQVHVGRAGAHLGKLFGQRLHEVGVHTALHQQAAARRAGLAGVVDDALHNGGNGQLVIRVIEHDVRRLAAQFQHALDGVDGGGLLDQHADFVRPGEGDEVDVGMARQAGARLFTQARHDVQRAGRKAHFQGQLGHADDGQAGVFGRLDHAGVAHGQCRGDAAAKHLRGIVPRNDVGRHAQRFANQLNRIVLLERNGLAVHFVGRAAVELEVARQHGDVAARGGHGLAGVARFQLRQFFVVRQYRFTQAQHQAATFQRRHAAPVAVKRRARRLHGGVHIGLLAARDGGEHLAIHGRHHINGAPVLGIDLAAVDNHLRHAMSPKVQFKVIEPRSIVQIWSGMPPSSFTLDSVMTTHSSGCNSFRRSSASV
ncbi:hypothetical protein D3C73_920020 [compost metagenome]